MDHLYSLESFPYRCPLAREAGESKREIRCLLFGKRGGVYRILYEVDETPQTVWILHIRHGARSGIAGAGAPAPTVVVSVWKALPVSTELALL